MANTIRVFGPNTQENQRLQAAAILINSEFDSNHATARVSDEWFDFPGGVMWTTITIGDQQYLTPEQQEAITQGSPREFTNAYVSVIYSYRERMNKLTGIRYGLEGRHDAV